MIHVSCSPHVSLQVVEPWAAIALGLVVGVWFEALCALWLKLRIGEPVARMWLRGCVCLTRRAFGTSCVCVCVWHVMCLARCVSGTRAVCTVGDVPYLPASPAGLPARRPALGRAHALRRRHDGRVLDRPAGQARGEGTREANARKRCSHPGCCHSLHVCGPQRVTERAQSTTSHAIACILPINPSTTLIDSLMPVRHPFSFSLINSSSWSTTRTAPRPPSSPT
jgi:hypothetical protein